MAFIFVRKAESAPPDYGAIAQSGATVALNSEDPHLAEEIDKAKEAGAKFAIWIPAHTEQDPIEYARHMASLVQTYGPSAILPNIETQGEGADGSVWSQRMMAEFSKYVAPGSVGFNVVVAPNKPSNVFNYNAYLAFGGVVAEAFGGDTAKEQWDPQTIHDVLLKSGVPEEKINVLLAPGQSAGNLQNVSAYTWDDMSPTQKTDFLANFAAKNATGAVAAPVGGASATNPLSIAEQRRLSQGRGEAYTPPRGPQAAPSPDPAPAAGGNAGFVQVQPGAPSGGGWTEVQPRGGGFTQVAQVPDAQNPEAVRYAQQRLAELRRMGFTPEQYGITGDPTAQWRALSAIVGAVEAGRAGQEANYQTPAGTLPAVGQTIQGILDHARAIDLARRTRMIVQDVPESAPDPGAPAPDPTRPPVSVLPPPPSPDTHTTAPSVDRQLATSAPPAERHTSPAVGTRGVFRS